MKLISFAIPCYNSAEYMSKCIESILPGGDDVEIIIVNDGSKDDTLKIAESYKEKYPDIIRVVDKENGGHGSAVNAGLAVATGIYYKVVDSDDWIDDEAYVLVRKTLKDLYEAGTVIDMLLTNYVYDKVAEDHHRTMKYDTMFPENKVVGWDDVKHILPGIEILMHSVTYRTEMLRDVNLQLPEHTFYVDNLFVYEPLPAVKTLYYLNVNYYHYYIGREGQSVAEQTMVKRIDQQLRVNYRMIDAFNLYEDVSNDNLRDYMISYLEMITIVSTSIGYVSGTDENLQKINDLWAYLKKKDKKVYHQVRMSVMGNAMRLPGRFGRYLSVKGYKIAQKFMGFN